MKKLIIILSILLSIFICNQAVSNDTSLNISKCNKKNGKACYLVAKDYFNGTDVEKNHQLAISYYEKSCVLNKDEGCKFLGTIYKLGYDVKKDYFKSFRYTLKACNLKNADACWLVGSNYSVGNGVRQDNEKAAKYYLKACKLPKKPDDFSSIAAGESLTLLGNSYELDGYLYHAKKYYGLACDCHSQSGCDNYARLNRR